MKTEFHAEIREQCNSLVITIPKELRKLLDLKPKQVKKFIIEDEKE